MAAHNFSFGNIFKIFKELDVDGNGAITESGIFVKMLNYNMNIR